MPSPSQSGSHSSGIPLVLQSWLVPVWMSSASWMPFPLQSTMRRKQMSSTAIEPLSSITTLRTFWTL